MGGNWVQMRSWEWGPVLESAPLYEEEETSELTLSITYSLCYLRTREKAAFYKSRRQLLPEPNRAGKVFPASRAMKSKFLLFNPKKEKVRQIKKCIFTF